MEKITLLHFINCSNTEVDVLSPQEVYKITPVVDKNNKQYLMVDYYDSEFCLYSTLFCEHIEFETKEINDENGFEW